MILTMIFFLQTIPSEPAPSVGSDDESNAATDGGSTTLRTPAEPISGGSESGGSGIESIGGASGRSSMCDQAIIASPPRTEMQPESTTPNENAPDRAREEDLEDNNEVETIHKMHILR